MTKTQTRQSDRVRLKDEQIASRDTIINGLRVKVSELESSVTRAETLQQKHAAHIQATKRETEARKAAADALRLKVAESENKITVAQDEALRLRKLLKKRRDAALCKKTEQCKMLQERYDKSEEVRHFLFHFPPCSTRHSSAVVQSTHVVCMV